MELEALRVEHAAEMTAVLADPALYAVIGGHPPSEVELTAQYRAQVVGSSTDGREQWLNWVVRVDARAVGFVQATVHGGTRAVVAWVIGTPYQRRGYATAAARAMLADLADRGVTRVEAFIAPGHRPSELVAERIGLRPTGELDADGEQRWTS